MEDHFDKALIFTDLHITPPGETIIGLDPLARFAEGLAHALARHPDAQHIILLGDLAHSGDPAAYARLVPLLADCPIPVTVTMGNHDLRAPLRAALPGSFNAEGFAQHARDLGPLRLLVLDTHDYEDRAPLEQDGWLCEARLAWLDAELTRAAEDGKDVVVFAHHPPCPVGFWAMDAIGLANSEALLSRLHAAPHVRHLVCGHIHRTIHASAANPAGGALPVTILKSPCHQIPMILGQSTFADSVDEPGAYGILLALRNTVVVHSEDFALSDGSVQTY
ncbi:metallophosphoesterase [Gymnodinialimonas ceratoperidinii]|uniref:Metallophosphoesterase n=1 Tax=Gymnodinialimonas ceratoperidinii TaxID=2856823 RepID=A0A8F6U0P6_9RHOB|nr:metallophosphoesterase [Gymnodinialimonas ceratoperidinii]QXT41237.1 metallophosphoesterase [Gymnodinialimonas ceratoperidinii]